MSRTIAVVEDGIVIGQDPREVHFPRFEEDENANIIRHELVVSAIMPGIDSAGIEEYHRVLPRLKDTLQPFMDNYSGVITAITRIGRLGSVNIRIPSVYILCHDHKSSATLLSQISTFLRIEIHEGEACFADSIYPYSPYYQPSVEMGRSISVDGIKGTGTLGCYVYDVSDASKVFGLTNAHVAGMHRRGTVENYPFRLNPADAVTINQNSDEDHENYVEEHRQRVANLKEEAGSMEMANVDVNKALENAEKELAQLQDRDREFGKVFVGLLADNNNTSWTDYALISPLHSKFMHSPIHKLSSNLTHISVDRRGRCSYEWNTQDTVHTVAGHVTDIVAGTELFFPGGRTSPPANCTVNGVKTEITMSAPLLKSKVTVRTTEFTVIRSNGPGCLIEGGDSGSVLLERQSGAGNRGRKRVAGLLFGSGIVKTQDKDVDEARYCEMAFFTPATKLLRLWQLEHNLTLEFGEP